jgi:Protein of unknown function (DUF2550)
MAVWQWLADSAGVILALVLLYALCLLARRRWIARNGGTFEFSVRVRPARAGRGWVLGVGRYSGDVLEWFRVFSLSPRPKRGFRRGDLVFEGRREPVGAEHYSIYSDHVIAQCTTPTGPLEVAMSTDALTGFLAWLEAAPPGQSLRAR